MYISIIYLIFQMFSIAPLVFLLVFVNTQLVTVNNFKELAHHHCKNYPLQVIWRTATGQLSEIYGSQYIKYDSYIRQVVGYDNQDKGLQNQQEEVAPDWVVSQYTQGIKQCGFDWEQKQIYAIWRYIRYLLTHDYFYQWLRAKMRISFGYQIQKPNSWIDGEQKLERLRLEKLFSNEYLDSLQDLMHRDFLFTLITSIKRSTTIVLNKDFLKSKNNRLVHILETRNYEPNVFCPVNIKIQDKNVFAVTIPGIPLLLTGSSQQFAWAFTGVLIDRSNIQWIQTSGMKYFDEQTERWIKIKNITQIVKVKGQQDHVFNYYWSQFGTILQKSNQTNKLRQYIIRWHENQSKNRRLFSGLVQLIKNPNSKPILHFPWNSLLIANQEGIHQLLCPVQFMSYFIYPQLLGQPRIIDQEKLWGSNPRRGFWSIGNSHLSTPKPEGYLDREIFHSYEESLSQMIRKWKQKQLNQRQLLNQISLNGYDPLIRKIADLFIQIYRKAKFTYFPEDSIRKEADQLVSLLDKWNYNINHPTLGSIYRLWMFNLKNLTFNHLTKSQKAKYIARHRLVTDTYFANQINLWKEVTSYGECDIHDYYKIEKNVNHTNHNCTCYYIIFVALNKTREFFKANGGLLQTNLNKFTERKTINLLDELNELENLSLKDLAFDNTYGSNLIFSTEIGESTLYSVNGDPIEEIFHKSNGNTDL